MPAMPRLVATLLLAPTLAAGCTALGRFTGAPAPARAALRATIDSIVGAEEFRTARWGILVVDPERGDTLYSHDADRLFMPASNMKILTSSVALRQLGPDYRFRTDFAARGPVVDSVLRGDLLVFGHGDPSVSDHMLGDAMTPLRALADSLRAHGIRGIQGQIVAAGNAFPGSPLGYGWEVDDLEEPYGAGVDELMFNEGFTRVIVRAPLLAQLPVTATTLPARSYPALRVTARAVPRPAPGDSTASDPRLVVEQDTLFGGLLVSGEIAAGDSVEREVAFRDQDGAYIAALREALGSRGIGVGGGVTDTTARVYTLFTLLSPPLRDVLPALLKPSQNQIAEALFKAIALERTGVGRADSARRVVEAQLRAWGAASDGFVVHDGSGLSRHDYVSPRTLVRVLATVRGDTAFHVYYDALPIAGVDGTLEHRMRGTAAERNAHAKTGTIDRVRSLSGYVTTADGRQLVFSLLANNFTAPLSEVTRAQDSVVARLARLGGR